MIPFSQIQDVTDKIERKLVDKLDCMTQLSDDHELEVTSIQVKVDSDNNSTQRRCAFTTMGTIRYDSNGTDQIEAANNRGGFVDNEHICGIR